MEKKIEDEFDKKIDFINNKFIKEIDEKIVDEDNLDEESILILEGIYERYLKEIVFEFKKYLKAQIFELIKYLKEENKDE